MSESTTELHTWRVERFVSMGFSPLEADALARSKGVDTHRVKKVLKEGCDKRTAFDIFATARLVVIEEPEPEPEVVQQ